MIDKDWPGKVLSFWFEELSPQDWFKSRQSTDDAIRRRFGALHAQLAEASPALTFDDPESALAAVIVLDQFSRNLFRGEARAFAADGLALSIARQALERGFADGMPDQRKQFFYMPFMHSENVADQERCVALFSALPGDSAKYAIEHRDIVASFGRFPHRNRVLGRETTQAERTFLAERGTFGQ